MIPVIRTMIPFCLGYGMLQAGDWPQWRGPLGTGHVPKEVIVPERLPETPPVLWRVSVGNGFASPVISGGRLFHLDNQGGKETVHALDAASGQALWSAVLDESFQDTQTPPGPRCTPLAEGDRVYVQSCRGELQCLDATEGRLKWRVNFVKDFGAEFIGEMGTAQGAARHGYNGPPIIDGLQLVAGVGGKDGAGVVQFDKVSGQVRWKSQNDVPGYAPPVLASFSGVKQVVSFTAEAVIGLEARSGELCWRVPVETAFGRHVTTPIIYQDMVIVSSHEAGLLGIRVAGEEGAYRAHFAWVANKSAVNFASPVAVGQHLYAVGPAKNLICVDMKTGEETWSETGLFTSPGWRAYAGFIVMGENILMLMDTGSLVLLKADPKEYQEVSRAQVCGQNWCNPAYADGKLYLRDARQLLCLQLVP